MSYYVLYRQPHSYMVSVSSLYDYIKFNSKANVKTDHCNTAIAIENTNTSVLVLENNITLNVTKNLYIQKLGGIYMGIYKEQGSLYIAGNNAAKTLSVTAKFSENKKPLFELELVNAVGIRNIGELYITGEEFLYTIKAASGYFGNSGAMGILCGSLESEAVISKSITAQANSTRYGNTAAAYAVTAYTGQATFHNGITGNIKSAANSAKGSAFASGISAAEDLTVKNKFACKMTVSASGNINLEDAGAAATGISSGTKIEMYNISKSITVSAKNTGVAVGHAIFCLGTDSDSTSATYIFGKNTAAVSVSAVSKKDYASAYGILTGGLLISDWNGKFTISAKGKSAEATLFYSDYKGASKFDKLAGNFSVSAAAAGSEAAAIGFFSKSGCSFGNLSKMKLTVKASSDKSSATAYGIYSSDAGLGMSNGAEMSIGAITVSAAGSKNAESQAFGIYLPQGIIVRPDMLGIPLEGSIKVTAVNGTAYGIAAQTVDVTSAVNINVKGSTASCAYMLSGTLESQLHIYNAVVKAEVSNKKNKANAYAVLCSEGTASQTVTISHGSKVTGNIDLGGGTDTLEIGKNSSFKGSCSNVENVWMEVSSSNRKNSSWDIMSSDSDTAAKLRIDFDYGLTGKFVVCSKESDVVWTDAIQDYIDISFGAEDSIQFSLLGGTYKDSFYEFELEFKGNKMILNVSELG